MTTNRMSHGWFSFVGLTLEDIYKRGVGFGFSLKFYKMMRCSFMRWSFYLSDSKEYILGRSERFEIKSQMKTTKFSFP